MVFSCKAETICGTIFCNSLKLINEQKLFGLYNNEITHHDQIVQETKRARNNSNTKEFILIRLTGELE